jgi:hypothetical protein
VKAELVQGNSPPPLNGLDRLTYVPISALFGSRIVAHTFFASILEAVKAIGGVFGVGLWRD